MKYTLMYMRKELGMNGTLWAANFDAALKEKDTAQHKRDS